MARVDKIMKVLLSVSVVLALVLSLSLAGCKGTETTATTAAETTASATTAVEETAAAGETTAAEEIASEPVTIEFWSCRNIGEPMQVLDDQFISEYMAENPNVTINATYLGRDSMTKIRTALAGGGTIPDLVDHSFTEQVGALLKDEKLLLNLNDLMQTNAYDQDVPFKDTFNPGTIELWTEKLGGTYMIPYYMYTSLWWYDQALFDQIGITEVPTTWDAFLNVCQTIKDSGKAAPIAIDPGEGDYCSFYFYWLTTRLLGNGKLLAATMDETGASWDDPGFLNAAQKIRELIDKEYFIKDYQGYVWPAGQIDWATGKSAMLLMGSWIGVEIRDNLPETFKVAAFQFPTVDGKGNINNNELHETGFGILKDSPHPEVAFDFIKYCLTAAGERRICDLGAASPVIKGVTSANYQFITDILAKTEESHMPHDNMQAENPEFWTQVYVPNVMGLVNGELMPDEFITKMKEGTVSFWANK